MSVAQLCEALSCSKNLVKSRFRSLDEKGVIQIINTGWAGTKLKLFLPHEITGALPKDSEEKKMVDIEALDF